MKATAHEIAGDPELYNRVVIIGGKEYDCYGYTRTGKSIKFARIEPAKSATNKSGKWEMSVIVRYLNPDKMVIVKSD